MIRLWWLRPALWAALVLNLTLGIYELATRPFMAAANISGVVIVCFGLWVQKYGRRLHGE